MHGTTRDGYGRILTDSRFKRILLYDSGEHHGKALTLAANVAADNGASLTVAEILPSGIRGSMNRMFALSDGQHGGADKAEHTRRLGRWLASEAPSRINAIPVVFEGSATAEILKAVNRYDFDLVIMTEEDHASFHGLFDMTATRVARLCPVPVWIVKRTARARRGGVAAAIGCGDSERVLGAVDRGVVATAMSMAGSEAGPLNIVRPWDFRGDDLQISRSELLPDMYREVYERHRHARADGVHRLLHHLGVEGSNVAVHLPHGAADEAVVRFVEENDVDLLVIGVDSERHTPWSFPELVVENIAARAHCSVLIVKSSDFVCPIPLADDDASDRVFAYAPYGIETKSGSPAKTIR